jgi:hypothetical protein
LFAAAWDAALTIARERLADTLLARSMEGNVEQIYRNDELIGERHFLDNRLGLQILRRLDRLAREERAAAAKTPSPAVGAIDWALAIEALRSGDDAGVARALALVDGNKVEEVEGAPNLPLCDEDDGLDLTDRCWLDEIDHLWMTDFPPPPGFTGYQSRAYDGDDSDEAYVRVCTDEEVAVLTADAARGRAAERAADEELRDEWFAHLRAECTSSSRP